MLYPGKVTGWAFMVLTEGGTFLELNISASDNVRVRVGNLIVNETSGEKTWENLIFDEYGTRFTQRIAINGTKADFLEIKNEGRTVVNISGNIKKLGNIYQTHNPYASLGILTVLSGASLLAIGLLIKPKKRKLRKKQGKT